MSWIKKPAGNQSRTNKRETFRQGVDEPVELHVAGIDSTIKARVVDLSTDGCRFRCLVLVDRGRAVTFTWKRPAGASLELKGVVTSRRASVERPGFEYGLRFDGLPDVQREALARDITEMQRRSAVVRAEQKTATPDAASPEDRRRTAFRASVTFPVRYRHEGRSVPIDAKATDLSAGGLCLISELPLAPGQLIALTFRLPDDVLSVYDPADARRRKPFEEATLRARVVRRLPGTTASHGIEFRDVDPHTREELARFIHAVQLKRLRR
ncbi:MAG: PilZ domain-containing protein [Vulcanimicrobiaceae bacterium]